MVVVAVDAATNDMRYLREMMSQIHSLSVTILALDKVGMPRPSHAKTLGTEQRFYQDIAEQMFGDIRHVTYSVSTLTTVLLRPCHCNQPIEARDLRARVRQYPGAWDKAA